jgi:8-oxo-dGTP diphosphatase
MTSTPDDPAAYAAWLDDLERQWREGLIPAVQGTAAIILNLRGYVLLQQRDDNPYIVFPGHWSLPGGVVEPGETPASAMARELAEETGLRLPLVLWKSYRKQSVVRQFDVEQFVFSGTTNVDAEAMELGEGQALRFFAREQLGELSIAFGFAALLEEYFSAPPGRE